MADMFVRMGRFACRVVRFLRASAAYRCLPSEDGEIGETYVVVLFRAVDDELNDDLVQSINATRTMNVTGTSWQGQKACRLAVSSWRVDLERDFPVVKHVLTSVALSATPALPRRTGT